LPIFPIHSYDHTLRPLSMSYAVQPASYRTNFISPTSNSMLSLLEIHASLP
jgi:hypothetical protein